MPIARRPIYQQVADDLAAAIARGEYQPGDLLPSETRLMESYGVSRPTARAAVGVLRAGGLVTSRKGAGTFVSGAPVSAWASAIDQTIRHREKWQGILGQFAEAESPTITRTHTSGHTAELLRRLDEACFTVDRLLSDPVRGLAQHRSVIPFDLADRYPALAENPATDPAEIYALLSAAGTHLVWHDYTAARPAHPDESAALALSAPHWVITTYRVTTDGAGNPLLLETLTHSTDTLLARHATAQRASAGRYRPAENPAV